MRVELSSVVSGLRSLAAARVFWFLSGVTVKILLVALLLGASAPEASAQCTYPCWSQFSSSVFSFYGWDTTVNTTTPPSVSSPFVFAFPPPSGLAGGSDPRGQCTYSSISANNGVSYYSWNGSSWVGPSTGSIGRSPGYTRVSTYNTGHQGIGTTMKLTGVGASSQTGSPALADAVFFHTDLCYAANVTSGASVEFGFFRYVKGGSYATASSPNPSDSTVYFYWETNANCTQPGMGAGACRDSGGNNVDDIQVHTPLPTPTGNNTCVSVGSNNDPGNNDANNWLFEAWLIQPGGSGTDVEWEVQILDPCSWGLASVPSGSSNPMYISIPQQQSIGGTNYTDPFHSVANGTMWSTGLAGYITAASGWGFNSPLSFGSPSPDMNVRAIYAAKP
jgi:hypothetical protein